MIPKHCPVCGRGLSAKYQNAPHMRFVVRRIRRFWGRTQLPRTQLCRWNGFGPL